MSPQLRVGARSDVGLHRHNNQDSMYAGPHLIAVADGVGGAAGGEVASSVTITAISSLDTDPITDPDAALAEAADRADTSIRDTIARDPSLAGMSTTLTAILATADALTLAHIGDSRAYLLRAGALTQLSHDHTLVQSLIDEGEITEEEALTHPRRSWITRSLDGRGLPDIDLTTLEIQPGDRFLVCSDGLSSYVSETDIAAAMADGDPQQAADRLTDLALAAGGPDNITCVVADPVESDEAGRPPIIGGAVTETRAERPAAGPPAQTPPPSPAADAGPRPRSIARRLAAVTAVVVLLVAAAVAGVAVYIRHQWYVAPANGQVAVYQGVQGSAAGIQLSHLHVRTNLPVTALPQDDRDRVASGIQATGRSNATEVVDNLRSQACALATATPVIAPSPTPTASTKKSSAAAKPAPTPTWCTGTTP